MNDPTRDQLWADVYKQVKAENKFACNPKRDADMAVREYDARLASPAPAPTSQPNAAAQEQQAGWRWVPVEPTDAMTWAGQQARYPATNSITVIYRAMLAAAPAPTGMGSVGLPSGRGEEKGCWSTDADSGESSWLPAPSTSKGGAA